MSTSLEYRQRLLARRSHLAQLACELSERLLIEWAALTPWARAQCQTDLHAISRERDALTQQLDWYQYRADRAAGIEYIGVPTPAWRD